jgi:hypothetical protein
MLQAQSSELDRTGLKSAVCGAVVRFAQPWFPTRQTFITGENMFHAISAISQPALASQAMIARVSRASPGTVFPSARPFGVAPDQ